jgi:hypothetical protein
MDVTFIHLFLTMRVLKHFDILRKICLWICMINVNLESKCLLLVEDISSSIVQLYEKICFLSLRSCSVSLWML